MNKHKSPKCESFQNINVSYQCMGSWESKLSLVWGISSPTETLNSYWNNSQISLFFLHKVYKECRKLSGTRSYSTATYFHTLLLCYPENQISHWKCYACTTWFRTDISILVVVSIAGRSPQVTEATEPPNFALVPILFHFLWQFEKHQKIVWGYTLDVAHKDIDYD
jgi:hypothetical protein